MPTKRSARKFEPWTRKEDRLLGKIPDAELAHKLKRTLAAVEQRRSNRNIPKPEAQRHYWDRKQEALLGKLADEEIARRFGRSLFSVKVRRNRLGIPHPEPKNRPWSKEEERGLGKVPDAEVARRTGRTHEGLGAVASSWACPIRRTSRGRGKRT